MLAIEIESDGEGGSFAWCRASRQDNFRNAMLMLDGFPCSTAH